MFNGTHINHETGKTLLFKDGQMTRVINEGVEKVVEGPGDYGMSKVLDSLSKEIDRNNNNNR